MTISLQDRAKMVASKRAVDQLIQDGMKLGLGSGTTSHFFVRELGQRIINQKLKLKCTTTSMATSRIATEVGIMTIDPNDIGEIDLTIDGPDEIDEHFRMIKGGGACLLWEKIIARSSRSMITICDETKLVKQLGVFPLPVEVVPFAWQQTERMLSDTLKKHGIINALLKRRMKQNQPVITDSGHYIIDCHCKHIERARELEIALNAIPGVVENGLFTQESSGMIVGYFDGHTSLKFKS